MLAFIGWGLWLAYHPAPVPLQGQVEAQHDQHRAEDLGADRHAQRCAKAQAVAAGALLVTLDSPEVRAKLAQAGAVQAAADAKRDLVDVGARAEDIRAAKAMWDKATAGAELADKTYQRLNALYKEGLVSLQRNDEAQTNCQGRASRPRSPPRRSTTRRSPARGRRRRRAAGARRAAGRGRRGRGRRRGGWNWC